MPTTRAQSRRAASAAEDADSEQQSGKRPARKTVAEVESKAKSSGKGLSNLGNTCFFNSVMQNMFRTDLLRERMSEYANSLEETENEHEDDGDAGRQDHGEFGLMVESLVDFFVEMGSPAKKINTVRPSALFHELIRQAPRYKGFQQHDAHELYWTVLDLVRSEECKRLQEIQREAEAEGSQGEDPAQKPAKPSTLVDEIFCGKTRNGITCLRCGTDSVIYEDFVDLSLPIPEQPARPVAKGSDFAVSKDEDIGFGLPDDEVMSKRQKKQLMKSQAKQRAADRAAAKKDKKSGGKGAKEEEEEEEEEQKGDEKEGDGGGRKKLSPAVSRKAQKKLEKQKRQREIAAARNKRRSKKESSETDTEEDDEDEGSGEAEDEEAKEKEEQAEGASSTFSEAATTEQPEENAAGVPDTEPALDEGGGEREEGKAGQGIAGRTAEAGEGEAGDGERKDGREEDEGATGGQEADEGGEGEATSKESECGEGRSEEERPAGTSGAEEVEDGDGKTRGGRLSVSFEEEVEMVGESSGLEAGEECAEELEAAEGRKEEEEAAAAAAEGGGGMPGGLAGADGKSGEVAGGQGGRSGEEGSGASEAAEGGGDIGDAHMENVEEGEEGEEEALETYLAAQDRVAVEKRARAQGEQVGGSGFGSESAGGGGEGEGDYDEEDCEAFLAEQDRVAVMKRTNGVGASGGEADGATEAMARLTLGEGGASAGSEGERGEAGMEVEGEEDAEGVGGLREDGGSRGRQAPLGSGFSPAQADQSMGMRQLPPPEPEHLKVELLEGANMYSCKSCAQTFAKKGRERHESGKKGRRSGNIADEEAVAANGGGGSSSSDEDEEVEVKVEVRSPATKQVLLWQPPPVLVLNLKRFMQTERGRMRKNDRHVRFPLDLDLSPFCHRDSEASAAVYHLYGVVEHHGSLHTGHYVAYCRDSSSPAGDDDGDWQYFSDTTVKRVSLQKVLQSEAYILFYRRQP